jgi:hypothetical protein
MSNKNPCELCAVTHPVRTQADMAEFMAAIKSVLIERGPMTVRAMFYQLVKTPTRDWKDYQEIWGNDDNAPEFAGRKFVICKTENEAERVSDVLVTMRENSLIDDAPEKEKLDWYWILDYSRTTRVPSCYSSPREAIADAAYFYKADMWKHAETQVMLWCEKNTLSGQIAPLAEEWQVPFTATSGFSSVTNIYQAAERIKKIGKPVYVYALGDYDPSGERITESLETNLKRYLKHIAPNLEFHFERLTVLPEHIEKWNLPTRPTKAGKKNTHAGKEGSERRAKWEVQESVEVDAIDPDTLTELINDKLKWHVLDSVRLEASVDEDAAIFALKLAAGDVGKSSIEENAKWWAGERRQMNKKWSDELGSESTLEYMRAKVQEARREAMNGWVSSEEEFI